MQFISWVEMQRLMTWWHDDMMQCKNKRASTKETHGETRNSWKSSEASVSGRHNTPPLQEDLVPRSRMLPEGNERGWEEVKLSCFFDKWVKPKNLERLKTWKKEYNGDERSWKHSVRKEEQGTLLEPCRLKDIRKGLQWTRSICKHSGRDEMYKER